MSHNKERIQKTIQAIAKAEANGKDSAIWQEYLIRLIDKLDKPKLRVKVGKFGFCTCTEEGGLCAGCWKIKKSCVCEICEVDPEKEMKRQHRVVVKGIH